ncbi:MAG: BatD family protein [Lentimicrobiaceae bacterium]|nr:BatD family protein [Lentimicrobiaceae bacterium]
MKKIVFALVLMGICSGVWSQDYVATGKLDTNVILIGDQVKLTLTIAGESGKQIVFPFFCDTCISGFEIVNRSEMDTIVDGNKVELSQNLTLTTFEEGNYVFPAIPFYDVDSVLLAQTQEIYLQVNTLEVDTLLPIKDIKEPLSAPITWKEILLYGGISLGTAAVLVGIILLIRYLRRKKKPIVVVKEKPKIPAHILALEALNKLRQKKLCAAGRIKEHYSELSGIMREYIENRWDISAMEMVSSEIISALENCKIPLAQMKNLEQMLYMADMVKFAKAHPLPDENSLHHQNMVEFVETTKQLTTA